MSTYTKADLKAYGINFRVDEFFIKDFFALKEAWKRGQRHLDCERSELDGDLRCLAAADWISLSDVRYVEENFIYSDRGFREGSICSRRLPSRRPVEPR